jgi:lysophospholipase L1-like esterase
LSAFVIFISAAFPLHAADAFHLKDGDRVVFYGDSITDQRLYTVITETYIVTRYPNLKVTFVHSGWGGDKVSGGGGGPIDERLRRDVLPYDPTVVTIMLGMNDGLYRAETEANDHVYFDGMRHIVESLKAAKPNVRIVLIQPSAYDDVTRLPSFPGGYNEVLLSFSKWLANYAAEKSLETADLNRPLTAMLRNANEISPEDAKKIIPDRIHPGFSGHLIMAEQLLKSWNARPVVASVTIEASPKGATLKSAQCARVSDLKHDSNGLSWTETDESLPLPFAQWEQMNAATFALVVKSSDVTQSLNDEPLTITGLRTGVYSLKIDGSTVATANDDQLARGLNLAVLKTPMSDQAKALYDLTVSHCNIHNERWRTIQVPLEKDNLPEAAAAMSSADALEQAVISRRVQAAQPKPHRFEIVAVN